MISVRNHNPTALTLEKRMSKNPIIPYNPNLKSLARTLRKNSTLGEILLWQQIKNRKLGVQFHRQVPIDQFIVDFYCHELKLAIEVDGFSHDSPAQFDRDRRRQQRLESLGINFIRIDDLEVKQNMDGVLTCLQKRIQQLTQ